MSFFDSTEVICEICGTTFASYGCLVPDNIEEFNTCDDCKKAIEDAKQQAKYLQNRKSNGN